MRSWGQNPLGSRNRANCPHQQEDQGKECGANKARDEGKTKDENNTEKACACPVRQPDATNGGEGKQDTALTERW